MRQYRVAWGEAWPTFTVEVPDDAELAVLEASFEAGSDYPADIAKLFPRPPGKTIYIKLMFLDMDPTPEEVSRHPSQAPLRVIPTAPQERTDS